MNKKYTPIELFERMGKVVKKYPPPISVQLKNEYGNDAFLLLVACLLSLRARDTMTYPVIKKLWARASTPRKLRDMPLHELETILYPLGFFRQKARILHAVSNEILMHHNGIVPSSEKALLALTGVGRKTMTLVRAEAFLQPELCVDTHVHRIAHHLRLVKTKTVDETELALKKLFLCEQWADVNRIFVVWGQHVCKVGMKRCVCFEALESVKSNW